MPLEIESRTTESTANVLTGPFEARLDHPIEIHDNTMREGEQPPGVVFTADEKLEMARLLDEVGVHWATVGFPAVSAEEQKACRRITQAGLKMRFTALTRLLPSDVDKTIDAGVHMTGLFLGSSDTHLRDKLGISEDEAIGRIQAAVSRSKDQGAMALFTCEDGSRTPLPRIVRMFQAAVDAGADYLQLADTVGVLTPTSTRRIVSILKALFPQPLALHFHDDLGLALANTLAGLEAGAQMVQATVNGAGERSGNTCIEEAAVVLRVKYGVDLGLRLDRLRPLCELVHKASGTAPSAHKSIMGKWCFTHESGIHVAGILANPETYQPFPPELVGRKHEIVFGKHSGAQGVSYYAERLGVPLTESARRSVLDRIKRAAEKKDGEVTVEQVAEWIRGERDAR